MLTLKMFKTNLKFNSDLKIFKTNLNLMFTSKFSKPNISKTPRNLDWCCPGFVHLLIASTSQANVLEYKALAMA